MVKEGQKVTLRTARNEKPFLLIKKEFRKLIFHRLAYKIATLECEQGQFSSKYIF